MHTPKSVTIQWQNVPNSLRKSIQSTSSLAKGVTNLLDELAQARLNQAETSGTIEGLRAIIERDKKEIAQLQQQVRNLKGNAAALSTKSKDDLTDTRTALDHAIELIVYLKDRTNDY